LYALESSTGGVAPNPGTGDVVRFDPNGMRTVIADHLVVPTAITFGPDGNLYVSNFGFGAPPGLGQILRIDLSSASDDSTHAAAAAGTASAASASAFSWPGLAALANLSGAGLVSGSSLQTLVLAGTAADATAQGPSAGAVSGSAANVAASNIYSDIFADLADDLLW
jgi:hypothetical protein